LPRGGLSAFCSATIATENVIRMRGTTSISPCAPGLVMLLTFSIDLIFPAALFKSRGSSVSIGLATGWTTEGSELESQ
jgi:hypothetical protein